MSKIYALNDATAHLARYELTASLYKKRNALVKSFSRGMRQRLSLSLALVHNPAVLIVDEPLLGLDPYGVLQAKQLFLELAETGRLVFLSTHALAFAEEIADTVVFIHEGSLKYVGPIADCHNVLEAADLHDVFMAFSASEPIGAQV